MKTDRSAFYDMTDRLSTNWGALDFFVEQNKGDNRDEIFLRDLAYVVESCEIPIEVYVNHKTIHPSYVLEKLNSGLRTLQSVISYFEKQELKGEGK